MKRIATVCKWSFVACVGASLAACATSHKSAGSHEEHGHQHAEMSEHHAEASAQASAQAQSQGKLPGPVLNTHELMERFNKPNFQSLKKLMAEPPADEDAWEAIEEQAADLAELANLVAIREVEEKRDQWLKYAAQVQQNALQLADHAKNQDLEGIQEAYQQTVQSCNDCHMEFEPMHAPELEP
jgi:cytochrome c556